MWAAILLRFRPSPPWAAILVAGALGAGWWRFGRSAAEPFEFRPSQLLRLLPFLVVAAIVTALVRRFNRLAVTNPGISGSFEGRITASGIETGPLGNRSIVPWERVMLVKASKDLLLVLYDDSQALYVPRRLFASDETFSMAVEFARESKSRSKRGGA
jgi:hypothetical protein